MELDKAITERNSCRAYKNDALKDIEIDQILDAARLAPSPKNRQPWRFIVLRQNLKIEFVNMIKTAFSQTSSSKLYEEKLREFNSEQNSLETMEKADTIILVFNHYPSIKLLGQEDKLFDYTNIQAIGAAIQNMLLKATDLGIGSLWICDIFSCYQQICNEYYEDGQLVAAVAFGYPSGIGKITSRKSVDELLIKSKGKYSNNLIWVGPRESDIDDCKDLFCGSVTIMGSNQNNNIAYCATNQTRIDHNIPKCVDDSFWITGIQQLKLQYPDAKIMYYNAEFGFSLPDKMKNSIICCNKENILKLLKDKSATRKIFSSLVPIVPFQEIVYFSNFDFSTLFEDACKFIFQENNSSGGYGTHIIDLTHTNDLNHFLGKKFMISPYYEKSIPINVHLIIGEKSILLFPGSVQIMKIINNKMLYLGADFITFQDLSIDYRIKLKEYTKKLGKYLQKLGYRGIVGFDFIITEEEIMFVETNARFQASTHLLNMALKNMKFPTMQEMQITAFSNNELPTQKLLDSLIVPYSMISYIEGTWNKSYSLLSDQKKISEIVSVFKDGYSIKDSIQKNVYMFKMIFKTNCTSISPDNQVNTYENLFDIKDELYKLILQKDKLQIKISLLNQGVIITDKAKFFIKQYGKIRNAVFSAVDLTIFNDLYINCPKDLKFSEFTPWRIDLQENDKLVLVFYDKIITEVTLDLEDMFCHNIIKSNIKFSDVCFWATDRLRVHHTLSCYLKKQSKGCKFCEVVPSESIISIDDILDVVDFYLKKANTFRHFLIGGGSEPRTIEYKNILKIVKHIREKSPKDIYVMSLPPIEKKVLKEYYNAGVTEIGFNIEIFDPETALKYMPGKGQIPREEYFSILREAVNIWGATGNVRSLLIVGLESEESLLKGIEELCKIGVMPILSVFRPISGTSTENLVPPSNNYLKRIYEKGTAICEKYSLHLGPNCPACQNNTLSLPFEN